MCDVVGAPSQLVWTTEGHSDWVMALAVSPDGRFVYSGSHVHDKTVKQWDAATGEVRAWRWRCSVRRV